MGLEGRVRNAFRSVCMIIQMHVWLEMSIDLAHNLRSTWEQWHRSSRQDEITSKPRAHTVGISEVK